MRFCWIRHPLARKYLNGNGKFHVRSLLLNDAKLEEIAVDARKHHPTEIEEELEARVLYRYAHLYPITIERIMRFLYERAKRKH
jgi:hypothetical protein